MSNSNGVRSLLSDGALYGRPASAPNQSNGQSSPIKKRLKTASLTGAKKQAPWVNPNHVQGRPSKKFAVTLNSTPFESLVSKKAPYASRSFGGKSIHDVPKVVNGKVYTLPPYNPLNDPHLSDYYARKLGLKFAQDSSINQKLKVQKSKESPVVYEITVNTSNAKNAQTNAKVFVQLRGTKGKISKQQLMRQENANNNNASGIQGAKTSLIFLPGSSETFNIKSIDIGDLIALEIEHDGTERNQAWLLEDVIVKQKMSGQVWNFICQQWLSLYDGDCQIKRILKPSTSAAALSRAIYEIHVITSDVRGAGTDAHVFITIFGNRGNTQRVQLVNKNINTFERGQTDIFKVKVRHLGKIEKILIEHDNSGFAPGWHLDKVIITNTSDPKENWYFICNNWLSTTDGDNQISRMLLATKSLDNVVQAHHYKISTYTGDVRGAGTDANVFIALFSRDGSTPEFKLNDSKNNFERNKVDTFTLECPEIGPLTRVRIRHDNSGLAPGWFLNKIVVAGDNGQSYEFPCSRWLSLSEDDGQISRDLVLAAGTDVEFHPGTPYNIHVTTGDVRGAGTSAKVYVILYGGENGGHTSGKLWIQNGKRNNFERGRTDLFVVECGDELSPVDHVTIGHDNSGTGPGWFLEKVVVESPSSGLVQTFFCKQWLAKDEGDGLIERDLVEDLDYRKEREAKGVYNVVIYTSDIPGAGTDANVFFVLYGENGKTEDAALDNKADNFERGSVDQFKLDLKDIGKPYKLRIWHDNSKPFADWHLHKVLLQNSLTKKQYEFLCDRWLGDSEEDKQCVRELPATGDGIKKPLDVILYQVQIHTGDKRGAGTDANVFLNIYGERGDTGDRPLLTSQNRNKFERKQMDQFILEAVSLGGLKSIRIGHDGKNAGAGWYLNKVVITDPSSNIDYPFLCDRWLAVDEDDGQIIREIAVGDQATLLKTTSYHVTVKTGDVRGAGTDANVYIILFGEQNDTGKLFLRQAQLTKNKFERGRSDLFTIEAMDIGKITKILIGHDGKGLGSGWFLESVMVSVPSYGHLFKFACNRWLDTGEDDGLIERELYPSEELESSKKVPYEVEVYTGDTRGAGTNARVFMVLYGVDGKSEEFWLRNKTDNFERGHVDKFKIECDEIGTLTKLRVGHDNSGFSAAWFLDKIIVQRLKPPPKASNRKKSQRPTEAVAVADSTDEDCYYIFPCNRWLAKDEDDGQIIRELIPYDSTGTRARQNSLAPTMYSVHVYTGDVKGSGTNSNVFLTLYGEHGDSGERELKKSETHLDKFERNQEDVFTIETVSLGTLKKLRIRHDNSGLSSAWFLDKVTVLDDSNQSEYIFPCNRWLAKHEDDGAISRELVPVNAEEYERRKSRLMSRASLGRSLSGDTVQLEQLAERTTYNILVHTGDVRGAGTDANVFVVLYGEKEDTGKIELKSSKTNENKFERNQADLFTVEAVDLGELRKIRIGHDNKGGFAGWYLDKVVVDAPSEGKKWTFLAGRWLDQDKEDGKLEIELHPSTEKTEEYIPHVPYEITVHTSDVMGAGTDSNVYVALYGVGGTRTSDVFLTPTKKERKAYFNRGSVDVFVRELEDVGEQLEKIRIGHDGKGFGAAWHLDKVEVRRLTDSESVGKGSTTFTFPCGKWLAKGKDDGAIVRELVPNKIVEEAVDSKGRTSVVEHRVDALEVYAYKVHVFTGDVRGAGTDANVFLTMFGENGDTGERQLAKSETNRDKFERNQEDVFTVEAADLGFIRKVVIRHDNSSLGPDWFLNRIEVVDGRDAERKYTFLCERWLAKNKDDKKIQRTLYEKSYEGDRMSSRSSNSSLYGSSHFKQSSNSLDGSMMSTKASTSGSPVSSRKASPSRRSSSADKVFEEEFGRKLKRSPSKRSLKKSSSLKSLHETIPYTVRVSTGEGKDHSTGANVFIVFIGALAASEKIPLDLIGKSEFSPGSIETFSVESPDVGEIHKIEVGHDGHLPKDSWYVKNIEVDVPTTGKKYFFPCDCWLGLDKEDGKTTRIFSVDNTKEVVYKPKIPFEVTIHTGDVLNAGTDAQIFLTVFGQEGSTSPVVLEKEGHRFERNTVDIIRLNIDDVGQLTKLRIGHDGKGSRPDWYLEKVILRNLNTDEVFSFVCDNWLSRKEGGGLLVRELAARTNGKDVIRETTYKVIVQTGDVRGCGTDANVFLVIFGDSGDSGELALKDSETNKDKFERASTDVFTFTMLSLGRLSKIRIWHDNKYLKSGWFLQSVEIIDTETQETYSFPCGRWLAKDEDDHSLVRELPCVPKDVPDQRKSKESLNVTGYELTFVTGDEENAGTMHNSEVVLVDENSKRSDPLLIENSSKQKIFRQGQVDTVKVVTRPLGPLSRLTVAHKRREGISVKGDPTWLLKSILVKDVTGDVSYFFDCNQRIRLSTDVESFPVKLKCTEAKKSRTDALRELKPVQYTIKVFTADVAHAGTNANVSVVLYGENGDTGKRNLTKKFKNLFERGNMDDFLIEALDLGKLTKLHVEHDNKGISAGWMLDRVEVVNQVDETSTVFPCGMWLDKKKGDKMISRDLYPA